MYITIIIPTLFFDLGFVTLWINILSFGKVFLFILSPDTENITTYAYVYIL